jgi:putative membrane protein insertion efficiency factor
MAEPSLLNRIVLVFINFYRVFLSPLLPGRCRFYPSCSAYAKEAFEILPFHVALIKTVYRILRCNPLNEGYFDPVVPEVREQPKEQENL